MKDEIIFDLNTILCNEALGRLGASFYLFGSTLERLQGFSEPGDYDVAIVLAIGNAEKALFELARLAKMRSRKSNWIVDIYTDNGPDFGYNRRPGFPLHLVLMHQNDLRSDSDFVKSFVNTHFEINPVNIHELVKDRKKDKKTS